MTDVQYATASNLSARQAIYAFRQPKVDLYGWALDFAGLDGREAIVDVGCGNGNYLAALERRGHVGPLVGIDFSAGMLVAARAKSGAGLVRADAASLPLRSASADVGLAMHMLYHVPAREQAVEELRRVVRPGGVVLAVLNSLWHAEELHGLVRTAMQETGQVVSRDAGTTSLDVEAGAVLLRAVFDDVSVEILEGELAVTEVEPVVAYVASMSVALHRGDGEVGGVGGVGAAGERTSVLDRIRERVAGEIGAEGAFRVKTSVGCLVCR